MSKTIHDAVLRRLVDSLASGDTLTFLTSAGHESISAKGAFAELLALRRAAKLAADYLDESFGHSGGFLRALLPESAGAEGGEGA